MPIGLGKWASERKQEQNLRFEKARRTALGIAQGVILSDADRHAQTFGGGRRSVIDLARERGVSPERTPQPTVPLTPPAPSASQGYQTPASVQMREFPGKFKARQQAVEDFLRQQGLPVDQLAGPERMQLGNATNDQVLNAVRSKNLGDVVMERGSTPGRLGPPGLVSQLLEPVVPADVNPLPGSAGRLTSALTSPVGVGLAAAFPGATAAGLVGGTALGTVGGGLEQAGVNPVDTPIGSIGPRSVGEFAGGFLGPSETRAGIGLAERAAVRGGQRIGTNLERATTEAGGLRGLFQSEAGGTQLPRGSAGAQSLIDIKEETLLRPGRATQIPGVRQVLSGLNPSVSTERKVVVAANARQAAQASLETKWQALRQPALSELKQVFQAEPPKYIGPSSNPLKNTLKDIGDNPEFYQSSPAFQNAARNYDAVSNQILSEARGGFNVDVKPFPVKEGGFYLPTVPTRESIDEGVQKVANAYTSGGISGKGPRAKTRLYEGAYQRTQNNPGFKPETNIDQLTSLHDRALANMAGGETFKLGAGGKTRLEVMQELHPKLATRMEGLRAQLNSLRGTAGRLDERVGQAIDDFLANPDATNLADLSEGLDVRVGANAVGKQGPNFGKSARQVNAEIQSVRSDIKSLRPAWEGANLEPYTLNRKTFRYHQPEESLAIDNILATKANLGEGLLDAVDEVRLTAFGGDISPLTIQGALGIMVDPVTGVRSLPGAVRTLFSPDNLTRIAQEEADLVQRFTVATGRPLGSVGQEFVQARKGIERIPSLRGLNERMMNAVEYVRYQQWKSDRNLLKKLNPGMTEEVADAEAANFLSKVVPALNPAERGQSVLRARAERLPVISTSFIGGPATFLKDAASGMAKLGASRTLNPAKRWQELSGREQLAILRGLQLSGTLTTLSAGSYLASGFSPEEAAKMALDPSPQNGRFLSIAVGKNHYIPIGGPIRSFVRGIAPQKVAEQNGVPVYLPFANLPNFARGKLTPPISRTVELIRNKDYQGRKIYRGQFPENVLRGMWYAAEGVLPLSAGEVSQGGRTGDLTRNPLGVAERTAGQLAGQDVRQAGIADRRNQAARSAFGRDWADLTSTEQLEIGPEIAADAGSAQILSRLRTIPEFDGITNDVRNEIYDFHSKVDDYRRQQIDEWGSADESWKDSAQTVAEQAGKEQGFLEWAIALHSEKTKAENRNQEYINFLLDHFDEIEKARQQSDFYGPDYRLPAWLRELRHEKVGAK